MVCVGAAVVAHSLLLLLLLMMLLLHLFLLAEVIVIVVIVEVAGARNKQWRYGSEDGSALKEESWTIAPAAKARKHMYNGSLGPDCLKKKTH